MKFSHRIFAWICRPFHALWTFTVHSVNKAIFIIPSLLLAATCVGFDCLVKVPVIHNNNYARAIADNMGHAAIAVISWIIVVGITREGIIQAIICGIMSSAVDVDHFVMAGSFTLKDALSLHRRPPLHTTTIIFIVVPILQTWLAKNVQCLHLLPYMFTVSILSHHLRDAQRRGLWFWPIGSTPPLPYWVYIASIVMLPYLVKDFIRVVDSLPDDDLLTETSPMTV